MNLSLSSARDALLAGLFGDAKKADHAQPRFALDMLSDWLPYRVYDEGPGLYRNAHSKGFILEVTPLIGADERSGEILGQFFSESLPQGACLQVLNFASPRIGAIVGPWFAPRYEQGGIYEAIAKARTNRLYDLVWKSGSAHAPFHARHVRLVLSLGVPVPGSVTDAELTECRDGMAGMLNSLGLASNRLEPAGLLALVDELNRDYYGPVRFDDIDFQMSARGQQLQARFVESYANQLNAEIADDLALPPFASVARPAVSSADGVRGSVRLGGVPGSLGAPSSEREDIARDVGRVQQQGDRRIGTVKGYLDGKTRDAKGASAEAADDVKEW